VLSAKEVLKKREKRGKGIGGNAIGQRTVSNGMHHRRVQNHGRGTCAAFGKEHNTIKLQARLGAITRVEQVGLTIHSNIRGNHGVQLIERRHGLIIENPCWEEKPNTRGDAQAV